jgi:hypothetical protein
MAQVNLRYNSNQLSIPVTLAGGEEVMMNINPREAFFDNKGYVRLFSKKFDDGEVGNFKLLPTNQKPNEALRFVSQYLIPFGLSIVSGEVIEEVDNTTVDNVARFLFEKFSGDLIAESIFEQYSIKNSAYYEITSGELVIIKPVQLQIL